MESPLAKPPIYISRILFIWTSIPLVLIFLFFHVPAKNCYFCIIEYLFCSNFFYLRLNNVAIQWNTKNCFKITISLGRNYRKYFLHLNISQPYVDITKILSVGHQTIVTRKLVLKFFSWLLSVCRSYKGAWEIKG